MTDKPPRPSDLPRDPPGDSPGRDVGESAPRFAVGELVMVRSTIDPARNTDCTRVIDREWFEGEAEWGWYRGWQYVVARHVDAWAVERSLRPRPVPGDESWRTLRRRLGRARDAKGTPVT